MPELHDADVIILGAGPAGLAAAVAVQSLGRNFVIIERGPNVDARKRDENVASGVGGAGLFSDGKFSFYPSATNLWTLRPKEDLQISYKWFQDLIARYGMTTPEFPKIFYQPEVASPQADGSFVAKNYLSRYMSLDARYNMIRDLTGAVAAGIVTGSSVTNIDLMGHMPAVEVVSEADLRTSLTAPTLIIATGRLGPLLMQRSIPRNFLISRRIEIGIRIEQPSAQFFLRDSPSLDPKRVWRDLGRSREWRTFCCCRDGEVITVVADNLLSVSGRADVAPTGRSSVGFHVRLQDPAEAEIAWQEFRKRTTGLKEPISESMQTFLSDEPHGTSNLRKLFGHNLSSALSDGLYLLLQTFEAAQLNALVHGPVVEGVMHYPDVNGGLKLAHLPVWVSGDASGIFRGITAALVSGYFTGLSAVRHLETIK